MLIKILNFREAVGLIQSTCVNRASEHVGSIVTINCIMAIVKNYYQTDIAFHTSQYAQFLPPKNWELNK